MLHTRRQSPQPNHAVDITKTFKMKIAALNAHVSQTAHNKEMENMVRSWGEMNAERFELPKGSVAEIFRIVNTN